MRKKPAGLLSNTELVAALTIPMLQASNTPREDPVLLFSRQPRMTELARQFVVKNAKKTNVEGGKQFDKATKGNQLVALYTKTLSDDGLNSSCVADVLAHHWSLAWSIVNGVATEPAQINGLACQIACNLLASGALSDAEPADKQTYCDQLIYETILLDAAKNDPTTLSDFRHGLALKAQGLGIILKNYLLTDLGFSQR